MNYSTAIRKRKKRRAANECSDCKSKSSPLTRQKLSPVARKAKAIRDKKAAMSEWGKYKKRTAQAKKCPTGQDYDHDAGKCMSVNANRKKNSRSGSTKSKYGY